MLDFIKTMFASALGFVLAIVLFFFFIFIFVVATSSDPEPVVRSNSILHMKASGSISERPSSDPFEQIFSTQHGAAITLEDVEANLRKAAVDEKIEGVLLEIDMIGASWPVLQQMRRALISFKNESGKFVYATTNDIGFNEQGYYLATAADSIFAPPNTMMMFDGFAIEGVFMKDLFDKIGVKAEVVHIGDYKTAGDSFFRNQFSDADREQLTAVFTDIVHELESAIAERTGWSMEETHDFMNQPPRLSIDHYYEHGLIDALTTQTDFENFLKERSGINENRDLNLLPNRRYSRVSERTAGLGRPARESIAVIHASGVIMPDMGGSPFPGGESSINATNFKESLDAALNNSNVKAIVVRIDSPGGSASTSDLIWQMIREASEEKPIIASMAGVAASGGYYIAMAADKVLAEKTTITGSIGVIGMQFDASELLQDKIGLNFDEIRFHKNANWLSPTSPMTQEQREGFKHFVDSFYDVFLARVAESRDMTTEDVHAVAQGRIWSGQAAYEAGLVDKVGGLDDAIRAAAEAAELEEYSLRIFPREKTIFELFAESSQVRVQNYLYRNVPYHNEIQFIKAMQTLDRPTPWTIMPYFISY